ncbi:MAG: HAD family hydrolase [Solirubrobacterales bacterium]
MSAEANKSPRPRGAVFDCDGLLVETADQWLLAFKATVGALGCSMDRVDQIQLHGASIALAAERLSEALARHVPERLLRDALRESFSTATLAPMPGAAALLTALVDRMPLAVATNAPEEIAESALRRAGLSGFFSMVLSAEQTSAPKPAPDVYLEACRQLGLEAREVVAFEDSAIGAEAARDAGLVVIGVPSADDDLSADLVVDRLDHAQVWTLLGINASPNRGVPPASPPVEQDKS